MYVHMNSNVGGCTHVGEWVPQVLYITTEYTDKRVRVQLRACTRAFVHSVHVKSNLPFFPRNSRIGNLEIYAQQSADICEASADTSGTIPRIVEKSPQM